MEMWKIWMFVKFCVWCAVKGYLKLDSHGSISLYKECLVWAEHLGDIVIQMIVCSALAGLTIKVRHFKETISWCEKALEIPIKTGKKETMNVIYKYMGIAYQSIGKYHEAIKYHKKCLHIAIDIGDKQGEENAYCNLGISYKSLGKYHKAIEYHEKSLHIAIYIGDKQGEGNAYGNLGISYKSLGKYQKAIEYHEKSLHIAIDIGDKQGEGSAYSSLGNAYQSIGKYQKAIEYHEKSLHIAIDISDKQGEGSAYGNLGIAYHSLGKYQKAIEYHEKHLHIAIDIGDKQGEGSAYGNLGIACQSIGKYQKAIEYHEKHLHIAIDIGDKQGEGNAYCNLGNAYQSLGKYQKAIEYHEKHLHIAIDISDKQGEGSAYGSLGSAYQSIAKYQKAIECHEKRLHIAIDIGDKQGEGNAHGNLGVAYKSLGKYNKAIEYYEKSLHIAIDIGDKQGEGNAYCSLGNAYMSLGKYQKAIEYHEKYLHIAIDIGDKQGEGNAYCNLGNAYQSIGKYQKAIEYYEKSLHIAIDLGCKEEEGRSQHNLGSAHYELSMDYKDTHDTKYQECIEESRVYLEEALRCREWVFDNLKDRDDFKISILDKYIITYKLLSTVLIETQQIEEALLVSDRGRARALGDVLISKYNMAQDLKCDPLQYDDVKALLSNCSFDILFYASTLKGPNWNLCIWVLTQQKAHFTESDSPDQVQDIEVFVNDVVDAAFDKMKVREARHCAENRSLEFIENSNEKDESADMVESEDRCIVEEDLPDTNEQYANPLEILYNVLVAPVQHNVTQEEVVVIPDGNISKVPFAALRDPSTGRFLSETKRIRLAPSLTTLKILHEHRADFHSKTGALVIGDPDTGEVMFMREKKTFQRLSGAKCEAECIGQLLDTTALIGPAATKEVVMQRLREGVAVIHIAAHGSTEGKIVLAPCVHPERKGIPEECDYMLTMKDVQESGAKAQLVVLSCCHSGRGEVKAEGVIGMSRAFLAAGARAVVASLWAIDDEATLHFMISFYKSLKMGKSASASLQQAMKEMRESNNYSEPRYWAAFFLIGDDVTISV